ncbi:serine/threonine protein kinase, partial [Streptomyces sp. AF1A]
RRTALIRAAGVVGGALLVAALAWSVMDAKGRPGHRDAADPTTSATGPAARSSASAPGTSKGSTDSSDRGAGDDTSGASHSASASPREPVATPYPLVSLDAKTSVNLRNPDVELKNGKGDIRFGCKTVGCELTSDTAVFLQVYGKPGDGTLDTCRLLLAHAKSHTLPLAGAANGTEICVKDAAGNIGVFVIQTKSTAMPDLAFLYGQLTVWREAA